MLPEREDFFNDLFNHKMLWRIPSTTTISRRLRADTARA